MDRSSTRRRLSDPGDGPDRTDDPPGRRVARPSGYRLSGLQGRVIDALGSAIVSGRFAPGELLPREPDLMAEFQASRPSLREALKVLAAKGLIEMRQRVGTRVRPRDLWNMFDSDVLAWHLGGGDDRTQGDAILRDLIELRQIIEPAAARYAATRASIEDLRRIQQAHNAMAAAIHDLTAYARADVEFHMAVLAASKNSLLARFAHLVADFLHESFRIQQQALNEHDNRIEDDLRQHAVIFDAINGGDGEEAAAAMLRVILNGKVSLLAAIEGRK